MKHIMVMVLAALCVHAAPAQVGAPQAVIVDAAALAEAAARKALVWDVRPADAFAKGHIPGALNIGDAPAVLRDPNTEDFIATAQIEKLLGAAGLDPAHEVIVGLLNSKLSAMQGRIEQLENELAAAKAAR